MLHVDCMLREAYHSTLRLQNKRPPGGPYPLIGTRKQEPNRLGTPPNSLSSLVDELFSKGGLGPPALKAAGTFSFPLLFLKS